MKNPDYSDTIYLSELIAPGTVNTMPEKTMMAYADHGTPGTPVQKAYDDAAAVHAGGRATPGVDLDDVFRVLEEEGVQKFVDSWDELTDSRPQRARGQEVGRRTPLPPTTRTLAARPRQGPAVDRPRTDA